MAAAIDSIEIKLPVERVEGLYAMHEHMIGIFNAQDNLEHLLLSHMLQMYWRLEEILSHKNIMNGKRKHVVMTISATDAMAFVLFWGNEKFSMALPGAYDVAKVINEIDLIAKLPGGLYDRG